MKKILTICSFIAFVLITLCSNAQVGYNCDSAVVITSLPYSQAGLNTNTVGNVYTSTSACASSYMNGNDYLFEFTPASDMNVNITLSNTGQAVGVFLSYKCFDDPNALCVAQATSVIGNPSIPNVFLIKDTTYFILVSTNALLGLNQTTPFDISVTELAQIDASVSAITSPISGCALGDENVTVKIINHGADSLYNFNINYDVNALGLTTETITDTILSGDTLNYTFTNPVDLSNPGTYNFIAYTSATPDGNHSNDTIHEAIMSQYNISTFPYYQNFESGPYTWTAAGINSSWAFGTPASGIINSAASGVNAWKTNLTGNCNSNENSFVQSHCFDMSSMSLPVVEIKIWYQTSATTNVNLQYSIDGGNNFITIGAYGDPGNWYNGLSGWSGSSGGWINAKHEVSALAGQPNVILRILFNAGTGNISEGFAFDDFQTYDFPANDLGVTAIIAPGSGCLLTSAENVIVKIKNFGTVIQSVFPVAFSQDGGATFTTESVFASILPGDSMLYVFNAVADLSVIGTYSFVATTQLSTDTYHANDTAFATIAASSIISTFPYLETFDAGQSYWTPGGTLPSWQLGTPAKPLINYAASSPNSWVTSLTGYHNINENSWVQSPCFDFTSLSDPFIIFDIYYETVAFGIVQLQASTDGGGSWITIGANGDPNWYNGGIGAGWSGSSGAWITVSHLLNNMGGLPNVKVRVQFNGGFFVNAEGVAFDNVQIYNCPAPAPSFTTSVNDMTISFNNTSSNGISYLWNFGDGTTSTLESPSHTYPYHGTYSVTLTVYNDCGANSVSTNVTVVGINEYADNVNISLYPNPAKDKCILIIDNISSDNASILIYNIQGQLIYSDLTGKINATFTKELNLSGYSKGVYYLKLICNDVNHIAKLVVE